MAIKFKMMGMGVAALVLAARLYADVSGPAIFNVAEVLAQGAALRDTEITVRGYVMQSLMTWSCPQGATCKQRPDFAPVLVIGDKRPDTTNPRDNIIWVVRCPDVDDFSPPVGTRVQIRGVVLSNDRGVALEHRETVFIEPDGKLSESQRWQTTPRQ